MTNFRQITATLAVIAAAAVPAASQAAGSVDLQGVTYQVDTLFHAQVGPGTTQTSLLLTSGTRHLRAFYTITDLTNTWVTVRAVSGTDNMTGGETVRQMATRKTAPGARYFAGVNGDFWFTSGTTSRGQSMIGTPIATCVADGTIYRALNGTEVQFSIGNDNAPVLGAVTFGGQVTKADGTSASIYGVNVDAVSDRVTLYNPTYYYGTNQTSSCSEVTVKFVDGDDSFAIGKTCQIEVVGSPSTAGDMDVPDTGLVLHGQGTTLDFINNLKEGDRLNLLLTATVGGNEFVPREIISGQPWVLNAGVTQAGDGSVHPRTVLGYDQTGTKIFMMAVDGRSTLSDGATTDVLGDLMRYAGAWMALNVDGGGSTTLYTSALGVRNRPSDGSERADANGIFSVSIAPDCDTISSIHFVDWSLNLPQYASYTPEFYGYNKYGMLIDTHVKGVQLLSPAALGVIKNDSTLFATGLGTHILQAVYQGDTISIACSVFASQDGINLKYNTVINDSYRYYTAEPQGSVLDKTVAIDPAALKWSSTDESVVSVDANGRMRGLKDGSAYVLGQVGEVTDSLLVNVQVPTAHVMPIDPNPDVDTWAISQLGGTDRTVTTNGNGFDLTYTGASARQARIVLTKQIELWSLPDSLRLRLNPGEATVKNVVFGVRANGGSLVYQTVTPDSMPANTETTLSLATEDWTDTNDMGNYPLTLESIQLNMGGNTTGKQYTMHFNGFETVYNALLYGDIDGNGTVNVSDVTSLINAILAGTQTASTDLNGDGAVNLSDVTLLINLVLASNG